MKLSDGRSKGERNWREFGGRWGVVKAFMMHNFQLSFKSLLVDK